ncbi:formyltransferase family protein [Streptomyces sp. AK02-04a]|uniref:formyltransferase family protein n=1 Tax=Streptomyces sp. AK02-04a TaxID=3028649 RepID=UPI0029ACB506|nr:formyltransferase family protein [Streptomyces sp. AK02-04a]MDX3763117.1 formyltransferase family protein [Streptomyces sp. AK02-04a]
MIFVGRGALLHRAVAFALGTGHRVDLICSDEEADPGTAPFLHVTDVSAEAERLTDLCTDGLVWSIDNRMIFRAPLLESGLQIYNIHNGLLPQHRGLASVAVLFALLHDHPEYGATLHEVDAGIDTGTVLAEERFPIPPDAHYHQLFLRSVQNCHRLFERSLPAIAAGRSLPRLPNRSAASPAFYGLRALRTLPGYAAHPAFARATDLGVTAPYVPEVASALRLGASVRAACRGSGLGS